MIHTRHAISIPHVDFQEPHEQCREHDFLKDHEFDFYDIAYLSDRLYNSLYSIGSAIPQGIFPTIRSILKVFLSSYTPQSKQTSTEYNKEDSQEKTQLIGELLAISETVKSAVEHGFDNEMIHTNLRLQELGRKIEYFYKDAPYKVIALYFSHINLRLLLCSALSRKYPHLITDYRKTVEAAESYYRMSVEKWHLKNEKRVPEIQPDCYKSIFGNNFLLDHPSDHSRTSYRLFMDQKLIGYLEKSDSDSLKPIGWIYNILGSSKNHEAIDSYEDLKNYRNKVLEHLNHQLKLDTFYSILKQMEDKLEEEEASLSSRGGISKLFASILQSVKLL